MYLPVVTPCSQDSPQDYQFEFWREAISPLFEALVENISDFSGWMRAYRLDRLILIKASYSKQHCYRTQSHLESEGGNYFALTLYLQGGGIGWIGSNPITIKANQVSLLDLRNIFYIKAQESILLLCLIPEDLIETSAFENEPILAWNTESSQGCLLNRSFMNLWDKAPQIKQDDASVVSSEFLKLLNNFIQLKQKCSSNKQQLIHPPILVSIQSFINKNLQSSSLTTIDLCNVFHCSRATLYRYFKYYGGLESYVRQQRLKQCFLELSLGKQSSSKTPIYSTAIKWGFTDPSYFSRVFKRTFGMSPSEVFYGSKMLVSSDSCNRYHYYSDDIETFKKWLMKTQDECIPIMQQVTIPIAEQKYQK